ncbi:MAG: DUF4140 domain-containing protein, partial [Candidatus Paceibacterales bacterium]
METKFRKLAILFFVISIKLNAMESRPDLDSRPTSVTVYPDRALVTRTARATLPAGIQTVKLTRLPSSLIKESVRVNIESASKVKILSSDLMTDFKSAIAPEDSKGLQRQLDELKRK